MTLDKETNFLYLADTLPVKYPDFCKRFEKLLVRCSISYSFLPGTKDVWVVDYMPIQVSEANFIQFKYEPDYLQTKHYKKSISDVGAICKAINLLPKKSDIILDGGNVCRWHNKVIVTDKIFSENANKERTEIAENLIDLLGIEKLIILPKDPNDFTGHADGMVRFINQDTVLINDYSKEDAFFRQSFYMALQNSGLKSIELPYSPDVSANDSAKGLYLNYLQMDGIIIVPLFNIPEDEKAVRKMKDTFKEYRIETIEANELAKDGGILNCITWNIKSRTN